MSSRGVVFGDVMRASDAWNDRVVAAAEGAGQDASTLARITAEASALLHGDICDPGEARQVFRDLVFNYTGTRPDRVQVLFEIFMGLALHSFAIGVLAERQRWDGAGTPTPANPVAVITAWLRERDEDHRFEDMLPTEEECAQEAANLMQALRDAELG